MQIAMCTVHNYYNNFSILVFNKALLPLLTFMLPGYSKENIVVKQSQFSLLKVAEKNFKYFGKKKKEIQVTSLSKQFVASQDIWGEQYDK